MSSEPKETAMTSAGAGEPASPAPPARRTVEPAQAAFQLVLLGRFRLTGPCGPVDLGSKKLCALLAYMICAGPGPQSRETLTTLLWGFEAQARQNLRRDNDRSAQRGRIRPFTPGHTRAGARRLYASSPMAGGLLADRRDPWTRETGSVRRSGNHSSITG